jgi:flavodoxin I
MKSLVIYDSVKGNTKKIAESIGRGIGGDAQVLAAAELTAARLAGVTLLVAGSPTMGGKPTKTLLDALDRVPAGSLKGIRAASFDTRLGMKFVKLFGYAAEKIAAALERKGARMVATPEGFVVKGREGPLAAGEGERAERWGKSLATG